MRKFENDVFISYAHIDNQPVGDGEQGWVTRFHATLRPMLFGRMGRQVNFWRDDKLQGNDNFSNEIVDRFKQSAVLVSIVTPRYLKSEWCTKEAHEFCRSAQETGGLEVGNKSRVFKVFKLPVAPEQSEALPPAMRELLGYEFYAYEDGAALELGSEYGEKYVQLLNKNTARLASEIQVLLETLEAEANASTADDRNSRNEPRVPGKPVVYLAECGLDRREDRAALKAELQSRNHQVLPERELPRDEADYRTAIARLLDQCVMSIHLVGKSPGVVPDGESGRGVVEIQNELAVARARAQGKGWKRVISLPAGTRSENPVHQAFIDAILSDPEVQFNAEVITAGIETVKTAVQTKLAPPASQVAAAAETGGGASIYVISNAKDRKDEALRELRKRLRERELAVLTPAFDGTAEEVRTTHEAHLAECDAVLIYYGSGSDAWKRSIDLDVTKAKGRDRRPKPRVFNWIAAPTSDDKDDIIAESAAADLIDGRGGVSQSLVDEMIVNVLLAGRP